MIDPVLPNFVNNFTIISSYTSATLLSPCSHKLHRLAIEAKSDKAAQMIQLAQYAAKPIDAVIQALGMLVFTVNDHVRDILIDLKARKYTLVVAKSLFSVASLPCKVYCAVCASALFLFKGAFLQLLVPYQTIYSVLKAKDAAHLYFYMQEKLKKDFEPNDLKLKPIILLQKYDADDANPYLKMRKSLVDKLANKISDSTYKDKDQMNPNNPDHLWKLQKFCGINHPIAIKPEFGGDYTMKECENTPERWALTFAAYNTFNEIKEKIEKEAYFVIG